MNELFPVLGLAFLGSVIALIGGVIFLLKKSWSSFLETYSIPFAAGVLLTVSLLGILPEAVHAIGEYAYLVMLFSFLTAFIFEHMMFGIHHHDEVYRHSHIQRSIPFIILGDTIHNFIDGVAIAAAYLVNPGLGLVTAISTFFHEIPHEIGDFGILLKAKWNKKKIILVNVLSASTTFIGALFVLFFTQDQYLIGVLLSVAAGLFLYLGAIDFLPHIHDEKSGEYNKLIIALFIGVFMMILTLQMIPHSHEVYHENEDTHKSETHQ
ncbi:ZIP family metal transporter [Patescibacteria group bacterium]